MRSDQRELLDLHARGSPLACSSSTRCSPCPAFHRYLQVLDYILTLAMLVVLAAIPAVPVTTPEQAQQDAIKHYILAGIFAVFSYGGPPSPRACERALHLTRSPAPSLAHSRIARSLEILAGIVADGLISPKTAFLRRTAGQRFDLVVVLCFWADFALWYCGITYIRLFAAIYAFRGLKLLTAYKGTGVRTTLIALPSITTPSITAPSTPPAAIPPPLVPPRPPRPPAPPPLVPPRARLSRPPRRLLSHPAADCPARLLTAWVRRGSHFNRPSPGRSCRARRSC